jgi:hypothetical protein
VADIETRVIDFLLADESMCREVLFRFGEGDEVLMRELHVSKKTSSQTTAADATSLLYHFSGCAVYEAAVVLARSPSAAGLFRPCLLRR